MTVLLDVHFGAMNSPPHTVVGLGEALWDVLPSGKHLGGAPLNFAYIASLLGENAVIATRIGNDGLGSEIRTELSRRNLDLSGIQTDSELQTGTVEVSFRDGQPEYEIRRPVAWDALEWSPKWHGLARKCDAVCFGSLAQRAPKSRITILKFLENTRPECLRVFDINLRKPFYTREVIESALPMTTILKMNDLELREIASIFGVSAARMEQEMEALLHKFSLRAVLVTRGERGAMAVSQHGMVQHPGFTVKVSDTIGAGDAFTAAATHCILAKMNLEKTLAVANWWASWVASQPGGMPRMTEQQRRQMRDETAISA
jgi:fructokinase